VTFLWDPLNYPFDRPGTSFRWSAAGWKPLDSTTTVDDVSAGRQPVLAIGSNASPGQLTRKFSEKPFADAQLPDGSIPVLTAEIDDVDVVYGAHLASYGSLPATLLDTPGACAHVFITWLTVGQLSRMHETEGLGHAYQLRRIDGVRCHGEALASALAYVTVDGAWAPDDRPLGLAAIACPGSSWPRGTQREAWDQLATDLGSGPDGQTLIDQVLSSRLWRRRVEAHLASHRIAETHDPFPS
jgi:hypothetical protein